MGMYMDIDWAGDPLRVDLVKVEREMNMFGVAVSSRARMFLQEQGKNSTGNLADSIEHEVIMDGANAKVEFPMTNAPYWMFVEKGVKGAISDAKAPDSPFKFGSGTGPRGGLRSAIRKWIDDKPVGQWRDLKTGRFLSKKSMAGMITRSVYLKGIAPSPFLGPAILELYKLYRKRLEKAYAGDIRVTIGEWLDAQKTRIFKIKF